MTQSMSDPYAVLGIPGDASQRTALEAYRRLAKQFHPDVAAGPAAGERMRRINEAWRVLSIRPTEPSPSELQREPGLPWLVIVVAVGALFLFLVTAGFLPPLLVVLLVLVVSRTFTGIR